uniref:Uncharacterized protein n=1 Tax=Arundo donax TaxID=35708 RepID=A0A0A9GZW8_ARUDO
MDVVGRPIYLELAWAALLKLGGRRFADIWHGLIC